MVYVFSNMRLLLSWVTIINSYVSWKPSHRSWWEDIWSNSTPWMLLDSKYMRNRKQLTIIAIFSVFISDWSLSTPVSHWLVNVFDTWMIWPWLMRTEYLLQVADLNWVMLVRLNDNNQCFELKFGQAFEVWQSLRGWIFVMILNLKHSPNSKQSLVEILNLNCW